MIDGHQEAIAFGFPPTGRMMRVWGVNFFRMERGQIVERPGQFDVLTMMSQLGLARGPNQDVPEARPAFGNPNRAAGHPAADLEANKAVYQRMVDEVVNLGNFDVVEELFTRTTSITSHLLAHPPAWRA